ncbi:MAG: hypothetical protein IJS54_02840 [Desulfovibrio sp.]|nr:hypothetical protein [Desulfovibrio sp.]
MDRKSSKKFEKEGLERATRAERRVKEARWTGRARRSLKRKGLKGRQAQKEGDNLSAFQKELYGLLEKEELERAARAERYSLAELFGS